MGELPPVLQHWFVEKFGEPSSWFEARLAFTRSMALMSMIGFAVGLGDRHLENILIHSTSGSIMHVDFACLFDQGLNLATPEQAPPLPSPLALCSIRPPARLPALARALPSRAPRLFSPPHPTPPHTHTTTT